MTTDHGMTLDEQIEAVRDLACDRMRLSKLYRDVGQRMGCNLMREDAATLLAIENTLRAIRDRQRPAQD